ncbi:MAG TPA: hypothetical protein PKK06_03795 [Phycisphaerae bacterium]|nr:hypothetical protein [Phycisphaerae bacterium]HNU44936.1 hypothetical protein [Phycisphaerae bacterium]
MAGIVLALLVLSTLPGCRWGGGVSVAPRAQELQQSPVSCLGLCPDAPGPEWTRAERARRFIGQDLFNHIDGAAEVFLEMGFREVAVQRYAKADATLTLEVYEMTTPTAARGMYLSLRGRGTPVEGVVGRNFGNPFQVVAQKDRYFIQINNPGGDEKRLSSMIRVVNDVQAAIPDDGVVPVLDLLPAPGLVPGSEVVVCGPYTLQGVFTLGEGDVLLMQGKTIGVAGDYETPAAGSFTRLIVQYANPEAAQAAYASLAQHLDPYLVVLHRDERELVFRDANGKYGVAGVERDRLDIRVRLQHNPRETRP